MSKPTDPQRYRWERPPLKMSPVQVQSQFPGPKYDVANFNSIGYEKQVLAQYRNVSITRMKPKPLQNQYPQRQQQPSISPFPNPQQQEQHLPMRNTYPGSSQPSTPTPTTRQNSVLVVKLSSPSDSPEQDVPSSPASPEVSSPTISKAGKKSLFGLRDPEGIFLKNLEELRLSPSKKSLTFDWKKEWKLGSDESTLGSSKTLLVPIQRTGNDGVPLPQDGNVMFL